MMFGWLTGRSKSNLPEPTALQAQKSRQIEQLKSFNQNVSEIQRDVEYRVNTCINGTTVSLYISLPPQFPQEKPMVKVSPRVNHPWVNDQMIVQGSPGINNFMVHSDLGKVIREIVDEFQRNPPTILPPAYDFGGGFPFVTSPSVTSTTKPSVSMPQANLPYLPTPSNPSTTVSASHQSTVPSYIANMPVTLPHQYAPPSVTGLPARQDGPPNYGIPDLGRTVLGQSQVTSSTSPIGTYCMPEMPLSITQLAEMSKPELLELLDNEDKLLESIEALSEVKQLAQDREQLTEQNEKLARENMSLKPFLEDRKKILLEKYDVFNEIKLAYDGNSKRQDELRLRFEPQHIQDNLKVAALQAEEESEGIADRFLEGKITVDEFRKTYMEKRKISHLRRTKEERLGQCLMNQSRGTFSS